MHRKLPVSPVLYAEMVEFAQEQGLSLSACVDRAIEDFLIVVAATREEQLDTPIGIHRAPDHPTAMVS